MIPKIQLVVVLLSMLSHISKAAVKCQTVDIQWNKKLVGHVFMSLEEVPDVGICQEACEFIEKCYSANFIQSKKVCELNNGTHLSIKDKRKFKINNDSVYLLYRNYTDVMSLNCKDFKNISTNELLLDASGAGMGGICRAIIGPYTVDTRSYSIDVDVYTYRPDNGNVMHPGLLFNVEDIYNADVVFIRMHLNCHRTFQPVKILNGAFIRFNPTSCKISQLPPGYAWFHVKVEVTSSEVKVFINDVLGSTFTPSLPIRRRGGIMVYNGYNNFAKFRNFTITDL